MEHLAELENARVVQISDTHLSAATGLPRSMCRVLDSIATDPPDLVIHTGDVVFEDPDDIEDRAFARAAFDGLPCPVVAIPGNHDVGFYGDDAPRSDRLAAFTATWGADRFAVDVAGWRLVGADAYLLGNPEHDDWLRESVTANGDPVAVFVHQPVDDPYRDGWEMPASTQAAFERAVAGADVRLVASGHRHRYADRGRPDRRHVWAPSTTIPAEARDLDWSDPGLGVVEYSFSRGGDVSHRHVPTS